MSFISKNSMNHNPQSDGTADAASMRLMFGQHLSRRLFGRGIAVESVRYHSADLEWAYAESGAHHFIVMWDPENLGGVSVFLDGIWIDVPSVLDWFAGVSINTWVNMRGALRNINDDIYADIQASEAMQIRGA